ncbi:hypothetical protein BZL30_7931 [Mycobacterium kansasii]|uniref:Uncharacterized protein n=1 Tax=Mycobacterium kansasii TaxID=1768 RepID=A0A1V3WK20_MYCKA|nr:hypothetical protein BZL30_7931 [Mycobacterium kansasii]
MLDQIPHRPLRAGCRSAVLFGADVGEDAGERILRSPVSN